jgi:peptidoglycan/xylan/chitin deacetylase (PgdA/CDA1 family)
MREVFLNFHGIGEPPQGTDVAERRYWWDTDPFLAALDSISAMRSSSGPAIHITFDDGNMSDARFALPALVRRGLTASFFVCAGRIGKPNYLDAAAIRDLSSAGMGIGSHGMWHLDWRRLSPLELDCEISSAGRRLGEICERTIEEVSIPFGSYDRRVLARLRSEGYWRAYTSDGGTVRRDSWLKARNTLDRSWQWMDFFEGLAARDSVLTHLRRALMKLYKGAPLSAMASAVVMIG